MVAATATKSETKYEKFQLSVDEYLRFKTQGFLVVKGLVPPQDVQELREHTDDLMNGRLPEQQANFITAHGHTLQIPEHLSPEEKVQHFLRIHMLHRHLELHERYLLHPRVLDALEGLIGPDISALQTMLFLKPPGKPGQGWHQDSFYIPTFPDTLIGAWIAIDDCDERNGAMWFAQGSQYEPIYPPREGYGFGERVLKGIGDVGGVSDVDDEKNDLHKVAQKYPNVLVSAKAGDVVFFGGHVLHRSKQNFTTDRFRRSFVSHYSSARSFTQWGIDDKNGYVASDPKTGLSSNCHILARGNTHLPFAKPRFGTPCAALQTEEERCRHSRWALSTMADIQTGFMGEREMNPNIEHDHEAEKPVMMK
jgi:ectoine hydroxylase-related dioxygenase (phytanoyl-CoA dioxygenase family)